MVVVRSRNPVARRRGLVDRALVRLAQVTSHQAAQILEAASNVAMGSGNARRLHELVEALMATVRQDKQNAIKAACTRRGLSAWAVT